MPPRKRKAAPAPDDGPTKRARIEDDFVTDNPETTKSGRPKRASVADNTADDVEPPKKRGRPAKSTTSATPTAEAAPKRARGRPPGATSKSVSKAAKGGPATPTGKKRGRPSTKTSTAAANDSAKKPTSTAAKAKGRGQNGVAKRGPGRPPKDKADEQEEEGDDQFWLMKAEPNDRLENGHNVKFSIDDLMIATKPEPWDGVRNMQARNNMRSMRKGDLAFFYHSNCKIPSIVGVMRIVQEHSTDESAFDPKHPYHDPKSTREAPKWDVVHVEFVKKFDEPITLKMLQKNASSSGELADMSVLRMSRLSVSSVRSREWRHILSMANEDLDMGKPDPRKEIADELEAENELAEPDADGTAALDEETAEDSIEVGLTRSAGKDVELPVIDDEDIDDEFEDPDEFDIASDDMDGVDGGQRA